MGEVFEDVQTHLTDGHYVYISEGNTAASSGTFNAGQIIYKIYGYKVRT